MAPEEPFDQLDFAQALADHPFIRQFIDPDDAAVEAGKGMGFVRQNELAIFALTCYKRWHIQEEVSLKESRELLQSWGFKKAEIYQLVQVLHRIYYTLLITRIIYA